MNDKSLEELKECFNKKETLFNQFVENAKTAFSDAKIGDEKVDDEELQKLSDEAFEIFDDLGSLADKLNELDTSFEWTTKYMACSSKLAELNSISMDYFNDSIDASIDEFFKNAQKK
ncbi:hypothetical protein [Helicobacter cetorum]|uniref:hypothetical protein n=1 Tax=Helicobacter cetorum TaxID=138563 RepID=UPI000CF07A91|nr:hypothetical protein [Helicobacter cetorum]